LLKKGAQFQWENHHEEAFLDIKSRLPSQPVGLLIAPNSAEPFIVAVDASDKAIGATLMQERDGLKHPVCYMSRKLNEHQKRHAIVEKEALALITAVREFNVYFGSSPTIVYTDHSPSQFLNRMAPTNQKLLRWCLELQKYNIDVRHRAGKLNLLLTFSVDRQTRFLSDMLFSRSTFVTFILY
jgi:RNase H-like domain found in reverse transcriptase